MVFTHVAVGLLAAAPLLSLGPWAATPVAVGAVVGGLAPDLDLLVGSHRRTLHFPTLGPAVAVVAVLAVLAADGPRPLTAGLAAALVAAGVHAASDALGAGREVRPWERTNTDAVYDHVRGRWLRARYLVPYDGSPRDLAVAVAAGAGAAVAHGGPVRLLLVALSVPAVVYTLTRRRLVPYLERLE